MRFLRYVASTTMLTMTLGGVSLMWHTPAALACNNQDAINDPRVQLAVSFVAAHDQAVATGEQNLVSRAAPYQGTPGYVTLQVTILVQNGYNWDCGAGTFVHGSVAGNSASPAFGPVNLPTVAPAARLVGHSQGASGGVGVPSSSGSYGGSGASSGASGGSGSGGSFAATRPVANHTVGVSAGTGSSSSHSPTGMIIVVLLAGLGITGLVLCGNAAITRRGREPLKTLAEQG